MPNRNDGSNPNYLPLPGVAPDPNTCGNRYAALTGSPYAGPGPRGLEAGPDTETYIQDLHQQLMESRARVAELEEFIYVHCDPEGMGEQDLKFLDEIIQRLRPANDGSCPF